MPIILTPFASDNFQRANEDPLNPANWVEVTGLDLAVLSNVCVVGTISGNPDGMENYIGVSLPDDQYCSATINSFVPGDTSSQIAVWIRTDGTNSNGYLLNFGYDGVNTLLTLTVEPSEAWSETFIIPSPSIGDIITIAAIGTTIYMLYNGVVVGTHVDASLSSGSTLLYILYSVVATDTSVSLFTVGLASTTPPIPIPVPVPPQVHEIYAPIAHADNVLNINTPRVQSNGVATATGPVAPADLQNVDDQRPDSLGNASGGGSNTVVIPNEGSGIVLGNTTENHQVQKTVHGRFDKSTVLNNPA